MGKIITIILLFLLFPGLSYATASSKEYLEYTAKYISENCSQKTLGSDCTVDSQDKNTCQKSLNNNPKDIQLYLSEYEKNHQAIASFYVSGPPSGQDGVILKCTNRNGQVFLKYAQQYIWNEKAIEYPKEENTYYAETHGDYSPAMAGDNNKITNGTSSWSSQIIIAVIAGIIILIIEEYWRRKRKK